MNTRRITLIVAIVLALGTAFITIRYLTGLNNQAQTQTAVETKSIVIASRDIPARSKITPDMLTTVTRPANSVEPLSLSDPKEATGDVALITIPAGSTVTQTKVGHQGDAGLTPRLRPGMRAVSIPVDRIKAVSDLIQPGDRVDVLSSVGRGPGIPPKTFAIIRGALVLAVNSQLEQTGATPPPDSGAASTITLAVTPEQADLLISADLNSTLRLALRSPQENVRSLPAESLEYADLGQTPGSGGPSAAPLPPLFPEPPPITVPQVAPPAPEPSVDAVTIIDGDKVIAGPK